MSYFFKKKTSSLTCCNFEPRQRNWVLIYLIPSVRQTCDIVTANCMKFGEKKVLNGIKERKKEGHSDEK